MFHVSHIWSAKLVVIKILKVTLNHRNWFGSLRNYFFFLKVCQSKSFDGSFVLFFEDSCFWNWVNAIYTQHQFPWGETTFLKMAFNHPKFQLREKLHKNLSNSYILQISKLFNYKRYYSRLWVLRNQICRHRLQFQLHINFALNFEWRNYFDQFIFS